MRGRPPVEVRARQSSILGGSSGVVMREDWAGDQRIDDTLRAWLRAGNPRCRTRRRAGRMNRRCFQKRLKTVLLASGRVQQRPDPALGPHETRRDPPRRGRSRIRERVGRSHGAVWVSRQGQHCVLTQLHLGREAPATRRPKLCAVATPSRNSLAPPFRPPYGGLTRPYSILHTRCSRISCPQALRSSRPRVVKLPALAGLRRRPRRLASSAGSAACLKFFRRLASGCRGSSAPPGSPTDARAAG